MTLVARGVVAVSHQEKVKKALEEATIETAKMIEGMETMVIPTAMAMVMVLVMEMATAMETDKEYQNAFYPHQCHKE